MDAHQTYLGFMEEGVPGPRGKVPYGTLGPEANLEISRFGDRPPLLLKIAAATADQRLDLAAGAQRLDLAAGAPKAQRLDLAAGAPKAQL